MKIAIIGAGFTGLSAACQLAKSGHEVTVFEKENQPGGLAIGYKKEGWDWTLEKHYHHWFTNDASVLNLAKQLRYEVFVKRPKTSIYLQGSIYQLDSPSNLLTFPQLSFTQRLQMAAVLGFLRLNPFWQTLEPFKADTFLRKTMGQKAYETIWEPQLVNKFGSFANDISLAWFWARIKKRTPNLAYPEGGFLQFAQALEGEIKKLGGTLHFNSEIVELQSGGKVKILAKAANKTVTHTFDKAIVTLASFPFIKLTPTLPEIYKKQLLSLKGLGAVNIVLRLKKQFLTDNTYWLSICEKNAKIMAIVEHTNFMDKKHYNNEHLVYLGNYLPHTHPYFTMEPKDIIKSYDPLLQKIHKNYEEFLIDYDTFKVPFAQPIIPTNYSKIIPHFDTPLHNVYLANIQQVYPWDRGTNYAVELGEKIAEYIL